VTGRPADAIIDHDIEEEDHHHHHHHDGMPLVRGQCIVVGEINGRSSSRSLVSYGKVIFIIAMGALGDGIVGRAFLLRRGTSGTSCTAASGGEATGHNSPSPIRAMFPLAEYCN
jgi:hypothetical protein